VPGNPKGYTEGETVPFRVTIDGVTEGQTLWFIVELALNTSDAYGFTCIEPWDTTFYQDGINMTPPPFDHALTGNMDGFNAEGAKIDTVNFLGYNDGYQRWNVTFTITDDTQPVYVVYGGHLAATGDPIASGGIVPQGQGASHGNGVFQARVTSPGTGDKTVNINPNNITERAAVVSSINVAKVTVPSGSSTPFTFITTAPIGTFTLTDTSIPWNSGNLLPGTYYITELPVAGWSLSSIIVNDPNGGSTVDLVTGTATINLQANNHVTVVFVNVEEEAPLFGSISVVKSTCPAGSSAVFDFVTSVVPPGFFTLSDGGIWNSGDLAPGTYFVTELPLAGWDISNIIVDAPSGSYSVDLASGTVTIDLESGSHVTIVYANTEKTPQHCCCVPKAPCCCKCDCCCTKNSCKACCDRHLCCCVPKASCNCKNKVSNNSYADDIESGPNNTQITTVDSSTSMLTSSSPVQTTLSSNNSLDRSDLSSVLPSQTTSPTPTPSASDDSVMFGLAWIGVAVVALFVAITTLLSITLLYLRKRHVFSR
jgi:hypothetical protein